MSFLATKKASQRRLEFKLAAVENGYDAHYDLAADQESLTKQGEAMRSELARFTLAMSVLVAPAVYAGSQRSVDARTLDIAGVKTGMDYDQALQAAANHFHVSSTEIKPDPFPGENIVTHTNLPAFFSYEKEGSKLTVYFEGRVPVDKAHPLVVSQIIYEVPWTPENSSAMAKAALSKYGVQSNAPNTLPMEWCIKPSPNPGMGCSGDQATLTLSQVQMTLRDPAWESARNKFVQDSQAAKPSF